MSVMIPIMAVTPIGRPIIQRPINVPGMQRASDTMHTNDTFNRLKLKSRKKKSASDAMAQAKRHASFAADTASTSTTLWDSWEHGGQPANIAEEIKTLNMDMKTTSPTHKREQAKLNVHARKLA